MITRYGREVNVVEQKQRRQRDVEGPGANSFEGDCSDCARETPFALLR